MGTELREQRLGLGLRLTVVCIAVGTSPVRLSRLDSDSTRALLGLRRPPGPTDLYMVVRADIQRSQHSGMRTSAARSGGTITPTTPFRDLSGHLTPELHLKVQRGHSQHHGVVRLGELTRLPFQGEHPHPVVLGIDNKQFLDTAGGIKRQLFPGFIPW